MGIQFYTWQLLFYSRYGDSDHTDVYHAYVQYYPPSRLPEIVKQSSVVHKQFQIQYYKYGH